MWRLYRHTWRVLRLTAPRRYALAGIGVTSVALITADQRKILCDAADHRVAPGDKDAVRFDPDTQIPFPLRLGNLNLVGLGVRKVSFLRVKVYSVGFYLEDVDMNEVPGWGSYSPSLLLTPSANDQCETFMRNLLDQAACAIRIVPTRNTDFAHLRDGFTRAIQARQKLARKSLSEGEEERISQSIQALKALFPAQSVPKGKTLTLTRARNGDLTVYYEGKSLGTVRDEWMSRELMMAYFADKDVPSPKLKEDVAAGLQRFT